MGHICIDIWLYFRNISVLSFPFFAFSFIACDNFGLHGRNLGVLLQSVHANSRRNLGELFDGAYDECAENGKGSRHRVSVNVSEGMGK